MVMHVLEAILEAMSLASRLIDGVRGGCADLISESQAFS